MHLPIRRALFVGLAAALAWFFWAYPPGRILFQERSLKPPFPHDSGMAYVSGVRRGPVADGARTSFLLLFEDGRPLGPAHAHVNAVRGQGQGQYVHHTGRILFSASDNSDPNSNGHRYSYRVPRTLPLSLYLAVLAAAYAFALYCLWRAARRRRWSAPAVAAAQIALAAILVQAVFAELIAVRLLRAGEWVKGLYDVALEGHAETFHPLAHYVQHPYLNYALNPKLVEGATHPYEATFHIRRAEKLRPRSEVQWRILVVGGSTTFGAGLEREEDTWVYDLERLVRQRLGNRVDVINGGVSGYNVAENFIHYVTLLSHLDPDVVLFSTGINDVHPRLVGDLRFDYSNYRLPWREELPSANPYFRWLAPYRYVFLVTRVLSIQAGGIDAVVARRYSNPSLWRAALERNTAEVYRDYLESFVRLVRAQGRKVGVLPQYYRPLSGADLIFKIGVDEDNVVNREVARELEVPFAGALSAPDAFDPEDTFDDCHFNQRGSSKMAEKVFAYLATNGLLPPGKVASTVPRQPPP